MNPVVIAESSAGDTKDGYDNFKYRALTSEYRRQQLKLIDLNDEAKFERVAILDSDLHIVPCRSRDGHFAFGIPDRALSEWPTALIGAGAPIKAESGRQAAGWPTIQS